MIHYTLIYFLFYLKLWVNILGPASLGSRIGIVFTYLKGQSTPSREAYWFVVNQCTFLVQALNFQSFKFQVPCDKFIISCVKFNFQVSSSCFIWIQLRPNFWIRLADTQLIEGSSPTGVNLENPSSCGSQLTRHYFRPEWRISDLSCKQYLSKYCSD